MRIAEELARESRADRLNDFEIRDLWRLLASRWPEDRVLVIDGDGGPPYLHKLTPGAEPAVGEQALVLMRSGVEVRVRGGSPPGKDPQQQALESYRRTIVFCLENMMQLGLRADEVIAELRRCTP